MRSRSILTLFAAVAAVGGLLWWTSRTEPAPSTRVDAAPPRAAAPVDVALHAPPADVLQPAEPSKPVEPPPTLDGRYALRYAMTMSGADAVGNVPQALMVLTGTLVVEPAQEGERRWLKASLEGASLQLDEALRKVTDFPAAPDGEFKQPFAVPLERDGRVVDIRFARDLSLATRGTLAAVMQAAQFVRVDPAAAEYDLPEWSVNGTLSSHWLRKSASEYVRAWRGAEYVDTAGGLDPAPAQSSFGEGTITLANGRIEKVEANERGTARTGAQVQRRPSYTTSVELTRMEGKASVAAARPDALTPLVTSQLHIPLPREPAVPFEEAMAQVEAAGDKRAERAVARKTLMYTLMASPASATQAEAVFRRPGTPDAVKRTTVEALAGAATPEAQSVLASVMLDDKVLVTDRLFVVQATVGVKKPREQLLDDMARLAYEHPDKIYASQVAMALGAEIAWAAEHNVKTATGYLAGYLQHAAAVLQPPNAGEPKRLRERSNWLGGLGNLASPNALPFIEAALSDPEQGIRASAAHALRFQDPRPVRERMQQIMHQDQSMTVRLGILHAARYMGPESQKTLVERALTYDPSENVRTEAAYVISAWLPQAPGLRQVLAQALEQERSEKVRHVLRNFLEPGRIAPPGQLIPTVNELIPPEYRSTTENP
ncbi:MAG: hypothetical protein HY904_09895 [Deltaproteobacteria bacterium]|nr:hypothetical protein [Deltaproteobacteria bacterium]